MICFPGFFLMKFYDERTARRKNSLFHSREEKLLASLQNQEREREREWSEERPLVFFLSIRLSFPPKAEDIFMKLCVPLGA